MKSPKLTTRLASDKNLLTAMEVFVAIAETRQFTQAARLMGMTQSAASQQLASLEDACDARLIDRTVRPVRLTQAGELCLRHAQRDKASSSCSSLCLYSRTPRRGMWCGAMVNSLRLTWATG